MDTIVKEQVWEWLEAVKDPEIPSVSIVDMGMVREILIESKEKMVIHITPTYVGCPALEMIRKEISRSLQEKGVSEVEVKFVLDDPWTSEQISEQGRENLKKYGIAPPPKQFELGDPWIAECPYCGSPKTVIENLFGPTACRSILYCTSCKNPFEAIKPV